ncbi:MAG TPA: MurT ligase domain-containing protein [Patescibacteria group bacterium]|nr:MurT ligase domain-containing protein [Patescibacteria group bacterium]
MNLLLIWLGKLINKLSNQFNLGSGSTWPGHIALNFDNNFSKQLLRNSKVKIIVIAGTNGKTTTAKLVRTVLEARGKKVLYNETGANLENGLASTLIQGSDIFGNLNYDYLIFESDENTLPLILKKLNPNFLILLNLFRDQLDRYGEIDSISKKWKDSLNKLNKGTVIVANADDSTIAYTAQKSGLKTFFFGLDDYKNRVYKVPHGADAIYCPNCNKDLYFKYINFSHVGDWFCKNCGLKRPTLDISQFNYYPLAGAYNRYNTLAAVLFAKILGLTDTEIVNSLKKFSPAFGRQEKLMINGKSVQLFLSKNPTSFNESLKTISDLGAKNIVIVLNDRIPDGRDVSWIWDTNLEPLKKLKRIYISGDRVWDFVLRTKYALGNLRNIQSFENLTRTLSLALKETPKNQILYILPTYSAMLEVRKSLTGRKIL